MINIVRRIKPLPVRWSWWRCHNHDVSSATCRGWYDWLSWCSVCSSHSRHRPPANYNTSPGPHLHTTSITLTYLLTLITPSSEL